MSTKRGWELRLDMTIRPVDVDPETGDSKPVAIGEFEGGLGASAAPIYGAFDSSLDGVAADALKGPTVDTLGIIAQAFHTMLVESGFRQVATDTPRGAREGTPVDMVFVRGGKRVDEAKA